MPILEGYVPSEIILALSAFLDFCYIIRKDIIDSTALDQLDDALDRFHTHRTVFIETEIRTEASITPARQHSLDHYGLMIREFGALNGLCSSITESKHITAVKEPWRRSNRFNPLHQMLVNNTRMDKLAAARVYFKKEGMLEGEVYLDPSIAMGKWFPPRFLVGRLQKQFRTQLR